MTNNDNKDKFAWIADFRQEHLRKSSRNPGLAALMSFCLMGLGQIYAGHIDKGIILIFIHLTGIYVGYSLFSGGLIYEWLISLIGPHFIIVSFYIFTVIYILIWIYNIKDAYYLSIFSSFRDWFEVERVLLPSMGVPSSMMISNNAAGLLENNSEINRNAEEEVYINPDKKEKVGDGKDIINVTAEKTTLNNEKKEDVFIDDDSGKTQPDFIYMNSNSWQVYAFFVVIVLFLGIVSNLYYQEKSRDDQSFQLSKNFVFKNDNHSYNENSKNNQKPAEKHNNNESINVANKIPEEKTAKQKNISLSQEEIESFVDNRIQTLLAINNKKIELNNIIERSFDRMIASISNSRYIDSIQSSSNHEVSDNRDSNNLDNNFNTIDNIDDSSNKVVVIQGNKEAKVLNKMANSSESSSDSLHKGVVLYESAESKDDVELVISDESELASSEDNNKIIIPDYNKQLIRSEDKPVIPNVNQDTLDSLKKEEELAKLKENYSNSKNKKEEEIVEEEGKVLFERNDNSIKNDTNKNVKNINNENKELEKNLYNKVKINENNSNFESIELKAKLEKIKERGAYEFYNGNWEAALPFYFEVLKYRRNAESFEMVGIIFEKMNKLTDAFEAYENAYNLGLDSNHNVSRLGLIAEKIGNYEKAQKYLEKAIENNPKRADIILSYARCLNKIGESVAAAQVLAVLRDSTDSYAIKKAAEQEYKKITEYNSIKEDQIEKDNNSIETQLE